MRPSNRDISVSVIRFVRTAARRRRSTTIIARWLSGSADDGERLLGGYTFRATVVVSGDKHLPALRWFQEIPIQRVSEFLAQFQETALSWVVSSVAQARCWLRLTVDI
jgi:hypothetical protein